MDNHILAFLSVSREFLSASGFKEQSGKENSVSGESHGEVSQERGTLELTRVLFPV